MPGHGQDARRNNPNIDAGKNAGASGDVDENKEAERTGVRCQVPGVSQ
jgi:hypothetical protein